MKVEKVSDPAEFLDRAAEVLADEARHNLILGIVRTLIRSPEVYPQWHLYLVTDADRVVAAASMTPPYNLILADALDAAALAQLAAFVVDDVALPGAIGNQPTIDRFVREWESATSRSASRDMNQGVFELRTVNEVREPPGAPRVATVSDHAVVEQWVGDFAAEAVPTEPRSPDRVRKTVARKLKGLGPDGYWIWEVDGAPVSLTGHGAPTGLGIRIGPVYTPPHQRGNGYASALVAAQSQWLIDSGYGFCFLYTDLANPTSNAIYERIGYRQIAEAAMYSFGNAS